jgi:ribosomal protein S18 acetylase RimI-like enzyme
MSAPPSPCTVRRAASSDAEILVPLFGAYREFYRQTRDPTRERAFLAERLERDESVVFLAEARGVPLGFTQLYPLFSSISMRRIWVLNDLYVVPAARKGGIGAQLLTRATEFARETEADYLVLETANDNPAQRLYEAQGWTRDVEFLHYERKT